MVVLAAMHWNAWRVCVAVEALGWPFHVDRLPAVNPAAVHAAWAAALLRPIRLGISRLGFAHDVEVTDALLLRPVGTAFVDRAVTMFWIVPADPRRRGSGR